ncbi:hypothetical protein AB0B30_05055 [Streptomyces narbonensis]|uniref:Uncharacterized protein n=1 Tax=Streptomyces narbonensis TaxID=67333 RepID=A0ABV3C541_9ACTN
MATARGGTSAGSPKTKRPLAHVGPRRPPRPVRRTGRPRPGPALRTRCSLYNAAGTLDPAVHQVDLDRAAVRREGDDVTVVVYGGCASKALDTWGGCAARLVAEASASTQKRSG